MNRRHLFICDTPFQIMMALSFRMTILQNESVEIIISDIITDSEDLYKNIKASGVFDSTYYYRDYELDYVNKPNGRIETYRRLINRKKIIRKLLQLEGKYDAFYATDTLTSIEWLYEILLAKNPNMDMYYYEEGPISVICDQGNHFKRAEAYGGIKSRLIDRVLGIKHINGHYTGAYVSVKNQLPEKYFPWIDIPQVSGERLPDYVKILNTFWDYPVSNEFKGKVVYLEESYYTDGRENRDIEIVNDLIQFFGKDRVVVKLHPRTRDDRFAEMGIKTYQKTSVPWELIALNGGLEGTVLVCMGSGAIMYPKLYWNIDQISIGLLNCKDYYFSYLDEKYYRTFSDVCRDKNLAFLPDSKEELFDELTKYR